MNDLRVLLVEDSADDAELVLRTLKTGGFNVASKRVWDATNLKAMLDERWDIVISDYSMPSFDGLRALGLVKERNKELPVIIVSGTIGEEAAVAAMRMGAQDYILKDRLARLCEVVKRELEQSHNRILLREKDEQLLHAQKMELVGRLAGGIAHDFNNILAIILLYCGSALGRLAPDDPTQREVDQIRRAGERAAALTKQLLAFSRKQVLNPTVINMNTLIRGIEPMLSRLLGEDVKLKLDLDPQLVPVNVDVSQYEQVLLNLVVNARDAMPKGGTLTIKTSNVEADGGRSPAADTHARVSVTDTGHGMPLDVQSKIFEPFFTTKGIGLGTGLGLSTVYGIVEQSRGFIELESEVDRGTTFHVSLPRSSAAPRHDRPKNPVAMKDAGLDGARVLLLEDNEALREVLLEVLTGLGLQVLPPQTPGEAIAYAEKDGAIVDLLICDVMMPEMKGPQLASILLEKVRGLKVLLMSGYLELPPEEFEQLRDRASFLQKPFASETLASKVLEILQLRRAV